MFVNSRENARRFFIEVWAKRQTANGEEAAPMSSLETMVSEIIERHPEYHPVLADPDATLNAEFAPGSGEVNPFLHMGLHVALAEQLQADRPVGIRSAFQQVRLKTGLAAHELEHSVMSCLAQCLNDAAHQGRAPDEARYLENVRGLG